MTAIPMFQLEDAGKQYGDLVALAPLSLRINRGETVALVGPSGSGKTTLLQLLAGALEPDSGQVNVDGRPFGQITSRKERSRLVGMMYQQHDIVLNLGVVHNVLAGRLGEWGLLRSVFSLLAPRDVERAHAALDRVGIADKLYERTAHLSGGEQQRVALARLLVQDPRAILADEPVSSIDPARAQDLIQLLVGIARDGDRTLVVSLHSAPLALNHFDRIIALRAGQIAFDLPASEVGPDDLAALYALDDSARKHQPAVSG